MSLGCAAKRFVLKAETVPSLVNGGARGIASENVRCHIYFLLDRSGSMQAIADDVIGGFNAFVKEQQCLSTDSAGLDMTMVQFDSKDSHEVLYSSRDISDVPPLCEKTFRPRGATPLFDAIGNIISLAEEPKADTEEKKVVLVVFSDGMENSSREHSRTSVFSRIEAKKKEGWTFVFMGANQDSYATGGGLAVGHANIQNFKFDGRGTQAAWGAVSGAAGKMRRKLHQKEVYDNEDFFDGVKSAEEDKESRESVHKASP